MKILSIIGLVLAIVGFFFSLSEIAAYETDASAGFGIIFLLLCSYFIAFSIVGLVKSSKKALTSSQPVPPSTSAV